MGILPFILPVFPVYISITDTPMKLRSLKIILNVLVISGLALVLIGCVFNVFIVAILGIVLLIGWTIMSFLYCYCPKCGKRLNPNVLDLPHGHCPYCGESIDLNQTAKRHEPFQQ